MRELVETSAFKRDIKRLAKSGRYSIDELLSVVTDLVEGMILAPKYRDHALSGDWAFHRECHIRPDWLLIYMQYPDEIILVRTGSHSDLFR